MDRSRVAEFALSWVLPPERAAAVTGDFLEEARERGGFWFWSSVIRLFFCCISDEWKQTPRELIVLGSRGFGINWLMMAVFGLLVSWIFSQMEWAMDGSGHEIVDALANWVAAWAAGLWIGRRAPGREIAACLGLLFVPLSVLFVVLATIPVWGIGKIHFHGVSWIELVCYVVVICGGLQARRTRLQG